MLSETSKAVERHQSESDDEGEMDEILKLKIENVKLKHQVEKLTLKVATFEENQNRRKDSIDSNISSNISSHLVHSKENIIGCPAIAKNGRSSRTKS